MIGTVGITYKVIENPVKFAIKNVGLIKSGKNPRLANIIFLYLLTKNGKNYIQSHLSGSTQQFISLTTLRKFPVPTLDNFTNEQLNRIERILSMVTINSKQNIILSKVKTELLNKYFNS